MLGSYHRLLALFSEWLRTSIKSYWAVDASSLGLCSEMMPVFVALSQFVALKLAARRGLADFAG